jgi:hypothetical protein
VLYTEVVRRVFFLIVLGMLAMDATGLEALVSPEPCTSVQSDLPDGTCPPLCARCACGVQVIVPELTISVASAPARQRFVDLYLLGIPQTAPAKVFHVPKFVPLNI